MTSIKRKLMVLTAALAVAGAVGIPSASADSSMTPIPQSSVKTTDPGVIFVRDHRGGHRSYGHRRGHRFYGRRGGHRYYRHHRGYGYWGAPFFFAPFYYGGYGYGDSNSCYWDCRQYHGPRYCRYHWRRYCY